MALVRKHILAASD